MGRVHKTPAAQHDLIEIGSYIAKDNLAAAERWLDVINRKCDLLADHPNFGPQREELGAELRSFPVGNYIIFYRPSNDGIDVIRVLHGARNIASILKKST